MVLPVLLMELCGDFFSTLKPVIMGENSSASSVFCPLFGGNE